MRSRKSLVILCLTAAALYLLFSLLLAVKINKSTKESIRYAKEQFLKVKFNDTIWRIDEGYKDSCNYSYWIQNYPMHYINLNRCRFPALKQIKIGTKVLKDSNSNECTFIKPDGEKLILSLQVEY